MWYWCLLPVLVTVGSLAYYPYRYSGNTKPHEFLFPKGCFDARALLRFLLLHPNLNPLLVPCYWFLAMPLTTRFCSAESDALRPHWVVFGCLYIDTMEYFRHAAEHNIPWWYKLAHKEHHQIRPIDTVMAFSNSPMDQLAPLLTFIVMVMTGISFAETMVVAALATVAGYADHTLTGDPEYDRNKPHNIHHTYGQFYNYQQPFFSFWDWLFNTLHPNSNPKRNPFVP